MAQYGTLQDEVYGNDWVISDITAEYYKDGQRTYELIESKFDIETFITRNVDYWIDHEAQPAW
jgi:hypothetical protein